MDYSNAHIIPFSDIVQMPQTITSGYTIADREKAVGRGKSQVLCMQRREQLAYHKNIAAALLQSDEVFLFGPTEAKSDLFKMLREDRNFDATHIEFYNSYRVTGSEEFAISENCFSGQGVDSLRKKL